MSATSQSSAPVQAFRFSTKAFAERERLTAWREVFGRTVCNLDIEPIDPGNFSSEATGFQLPGLGVLFVVSGAVDLKHTRELIADDDLSFMAAPTSPFIASQLGRTLQLEPGAGVLMNNAEIGHIRVASSSRFTTFRVPRAAIKPLVPDIDAAVARRVPANNAALGLLIRYLESTRDTQALTSPELRHLAITHVYDLLAVALGATRDAAEIASGRGLRAARFAAITADIAKNIDRHDLSAEWVAPRHRVSPSTVRRLLEEHDTTFSQFVLGYRLAQAHRCLGDPRILERTISSIAFSLGFNDLSYFNRTFRRLYGATPSDVRETVFRDASRDNKRS
jgi:AraC-like DNA-binding protein